MKKTDKEIRADAANLLAEGADLADVSNGLGTADTEEERDYFRRLQRAMESVIEAECALEDARELVAAFGQEAELEAAQRANRAIEAGDPLLERRWKKGLAQVRLLAAKAARC
jgi:hypothetical protein